MNIKFTDKTIKPKMLTVEGLPAFSKSKKMMKNSKYYAGVWGALELLKNTFPENTRFADLLQELIEETEGRING